MVDFDSLLAEKAELDVLIGNGTAFEIPAEGLVRLFGKKNWTFRLTQPFLGTLDKVSAVAMEMAMDEALIKANPLSESRKLVRQNARRAAKIVAISVLNSHWKITLFTWLLTEYFFWRITPQMLGHLTIVIQKLSNLADFTLSIRYLSANRTSSPNRMEKTQGDQPAL